MNESQENELSLLKAMYKENELVFGNHLARYNSDNGETSEGTVPVSDQPGKDNETAFCLKIKCSDLVTINLDVQFPNDYPSKKYPFVNARSGKINEMNLNTDLKKFINSELELGMPMVLEIENWIKENYEQYIVNGNIRVSTPTQHTYARLWIYMHHLYSGTKRKDLKMHAKRLQLNGFSMPGKPSVIVIEGILEDCEEFWILVRGWSWQDIVLRHKETSRSKDFLKLPKFFELVSHKTYLDSKHADCSFLKATLKQYDLEKYFETLIQI